ncbi:MAG: ATP-dependent zinc metalloprotease FtsH [Victivallaceae bacterium]|nr:ATP-dependent zinc metalloprotease FtsH [Victivallaceae bacterium]
MQKEKKVPGVPKSPLKRPLPPSGMVWLAVLLLVTTLFFFGRNTGKTAEFTQTQFEKQLAAGRIVSANIASRANDVLFVTGKYKLDQAQAALAADTADGADGTGAYECQLLNSEQLQSAIREKVATVEVVPAESWYSYLLPALPMLLLIVLLWIFFARQFKNANKGAMQFGKSRAKMVAPDEINVTFDDVAGCDEAKEEVREIVDFLRDPLKFKMIGGKIPKGCLLTGPPGTGKTLLAKAVACEAGVPFFAISGSDFVEMFVGVGASRVRDMFDQAKSSAPCLIFIDEIDAVGRSRFSGLGGGHDEREQTLNALLVEMDGLEARSDVIVLAATNRPDVLDQALLRPGRFDRQVVIDLPDIVGRRKILDVHIKKIKTAAGIDLDVLARHTTGLSGADLANMCNEAALLAATSGREEVTQHDLEEASEKVRWGRERKSRRISDRDRRNTAYHEAGHAIVDIFCEHATPLHKVTIIPRGQALGLTFMLSEEDEYTQTRLELLDEMAVSMGGRVAEEIVFGDVATGAVADIERASHIARMMVCVFGMNDKIGPIKYGDFREHVHVRLDAAPQDILSPETAREIDLAVREFVTQAHDHAREILSRERERLEKLAAALLERETLSAAEVYELLSLTPPGAKDVTIKPAETPLEA